MHCAATPLTFGRPRLCLSAVGVVGPAVSVAPLAAGFVCREKGACGERVMVWWVLLVCLCGGLAVAAVVCGVLVLRQSRRELEELDARLRRLQARGWFVHPGPETEERMRRRLGRAFKE